MKKTPTFILASASPRRRGLLKTLGIPFRVLPSRVTEPAPRGRVSPARYTMDLAERKARSVARRVKTGFILGADTIVYRRGKIYGKPASISDARRILKVLAGRWHSVYTGLCLAARPGDRVWRTVRRTDVKMRAFSEEALDRWSRRNHDKAGAYAAQARDNPFVEAFRGDFDNVVGLPLKGVKQLLARARRAGVRVR